MAKKKSGRQFLESSEERIISDEFDRAVKFVRRQVIKGDAAKYYDLHGKVLHRRKATAIAYMEQIKERYEDITASLRFWIPTTMQHPTEVECCLVD